MKTLNKIPATPRSKYYKNVIIGGSASQIATGGLSYVGSTGLPYSVDDNGDYVVDKGISLPFVTVGEKKIDAEKVITWDNAVAAMHTHSNKRYLDDINQDLSKTSTVEFAGIQNRGVLNMHNNNVWAVSYVDFNAYETDGEVKWNTISNLEKDGFGFNNHIHTSGNIEFRGDVTRTLFSHNRDMTLIRYNENWQRGSYLMFGSFALQGNRLFLDDELKVGGNATIDRNLTVKGAFSCYELVVNKVRSTNGYLYVTDSTPILQIIYTGYNNLMQSEAKIKIEAGRLLQGDYVMLQKFTGDRVAKMTFYVSYAETNENVFIVNQDGFGLEDLQSFLKVNDCLVKYDSKTEDRRTGILLSPYDKGYIDFYTGSGNGNETAKTITTSLGNLDHLGIEGITGYGLYSDNAYIRGKINATDAEINRMFRRQNILINLDLPSNQRPNKLDFTTGNCYFIYCNQGGGEYNFQIEDPNNIKYDGVQLQVIICTEGSPETSVIIGGWNNLADTAKELADHHGIGITTLTFTYVYQLTVGIRRVGWVLTGSQKSNIY